MLILIFLKKIRERTKELRKNKMFLLKFVLFGGLILLTSTTRPENAGYCLIHFRCCCYPNTSILSDIYHLVCKLKQKSRIIMLRLKHWQNGHKQNQKELFTYLTYMVLFLSNLWVSATLDASIICIFFRVLTSMPLINNDTIRILTLVQPFNWYISLFSF